MYLTRDAADRPGATHDDPGFSLIELLVVLLVVAVLGTVVIAALAQYRDDAEDSACPADLRHLNTAVESYFAQLDTTAIAPTDATPDGYEKTLVAEGMMRGVSEFYDVDDTGTITPAVGSPCTVVLT